VLLVSCGWWGRFSRLTGNLLLIRCLQSCPYTPERPRFWLGAAARNVTWGGYTSTQLRRILKKTIYKDHHSSQKLRFALGYKQAFGFPEDITGCEFAV
jgi:hypothetical protein